MALGYKLSSSHHREMSTVNLPWAVSIVLKYSDNQTLRGGGCYWICHIANFTPTLFKSCAIGPGKASHLRNVVNLVLRSAPDFILNFRIGGRLIFTLPVKKAD